MRERLNIDCLRMLSYQDDNSDYEESPYRKAKTSYEPKKEEEVWHQILSRQG